MIKMMAITMMKYIGYDEVYICDVFVYSELSGEQDTRQGSLAVAGFGLVKIMMIVMFCYGNNILIDVGSSDDKKPLQDWTGLP